MKTKKLIFLLVAALLCTMILCGCLSGSSNNTSQDNDSSAQPANDDPILREALAEDNAFYKLSCIVPDASHTDSLLENVLATAEQYLSGTAKFMDSYSLDPLTDYYIVGELTLPEFTLKAIEAQEDDNLYVYCSSGIDTNYDTLITRYASTAHFCTGKFDESLDDSAEHSQALFFCANDASEIREINYVCYIAVDPCSDGTYINRGFLDIEQDYGLYCVKSSDIASERKYLFFYRASVPQNEPTTE